MTDRSDWRLITNGLCRSDSTFLSCNATLGSSSSPRPLDSRAGCCWGRFRLYTRSSMLCGALYLSNIGSARRRISAVAGRQKGSPLFVRGDANSNRKRRFTMKVRARHEGLFLR